MSAANFTQASTTNIIPFGSGKSYVVRDLLIENDVEHRFTDKLGRTEKDRQFLVQFETIFLAAATGDLSKCQTVIDEGFRDFKAVSFGKFQTDSGEKLDDVSPLNIAVRKKHNKIVALFRETQRKMAQFSPANLQGEKVSLDFKIQSTLNNYRGISTLFSLQACRFFLYVNHIAFNTNAWRQPMAHLFSIIMFL